MQILNNYRNNFQQGSLNPCQTLGRLRNGPSYRCTVFLEIHHGHLLDTCSKWIINFDTWCRLLFRTNCVQSTFMCMKGTWVHVYTVWVSQIHDLCTDFDNFHIILIIFYIIFTLLRGQIRVTTHGLQMRRTLIMFRDPL